MDVLTPTYMAVLTGLELGKQVRHHTSRHRNNGLEQDHRGLKGRYRPMRGFKCPRSAAGFCRGYDELRNRYCQVNQSCNDFPQYSFVAGCV